MLTAMAATASVSEARAAQPNRPVMAQHTAPFQRAAPTFHAAPVQHTVKHPPPRIVHVQQHPVAHTQVKTPPTPPPPPNKNPKGKPGCDPPYYFEGTKKIFKAQCL